MPTASSNATRRNALAIGSEVPAADFTFRVHSVFDAALNVEIPGRRMLVTLVGPGGDDLPQGIRIALRESFEAWPVAAGTRGRRDARTLVFDGPDGGEAVVVDLSSAVTGVRAALPLVDPAAEPTRAAWAACAFHLDGLQEEREADLRLSALCGMTEPDTTAGEHLADAARTLAAAIRADDAPAAGRTATRLVGLGAGLTPSGDDFLCGLLAALWCASGEGSPDRRFVHAWGERLAERLATTSAISATFLECAIAGCFPGTVRTLACAFADGRDGGTHESPRRALDALCAVGHSSGMDTATGFLFGLWLRTDEETRRYAPRL